MKQQIELNKSILKSHEDRLRVEIGKLGYVDNLETVKRIVDEVKCLKMNIEELELLNL